MSPSPLDRARAGDELAFDELTSPFVRELHVHCYRLLGSLTDADDLLQETLLAAWRGLDGYAGRASLRTWLYRLATNRCLNAIRDATRRVPAEPVPTFQPPEPTRRSGAGWLQPYPDRWLEQLAEPGPEARIESREAVELAFVAALQRLPPRQAAALVLADVLGFSTTEVAGLLDSTTTAVKGVLQRARTSLAGHRAGHTHEPTGGRGSAAERDLAGRFADRFGAGDVAGVVALLTDDAWLAMPPAPHEYRGPAAIAAFLRISVQARVRRSITLAPTRANGQPAFCLYADPSGVESTDPSGVVVLTMAGSRITRITRFLDGAVPPHFGPRARPLNAAASAGDRKRFS